MAEQKRDYYEVLGVPKDADEAALKKAYRALAKKYHPDANPGDKEAEAKFKEASEAYSILSDPEKRRQYDQFGHAAFDGPGGGGGGGFYGNAADFSDIFGDLFGDGGGIFGDFFTGGRRSTASANEPQKGANVRTSVRLTFEEAVFGCEKEITVNFKETCTVCHGTGAKAGTNPETCPTCQGKGKIVQMSRTMFGTMQNVQTCPNCRGAGKVIKEKCTSCNGTGYNQKRKTFRVTIPAGIDNGLSVRMAGGGEPGVNGGDRGDLLVECSSGRYDPHPHRGRGSGVHCEGRHPDRYQSAAPRQGSSFPPQQECTGRPLRHAGRGCAHQADPGAEGRPAGVRRRDDWRRQFQKERTV